jgi:tRNA-specific 2-thiouridylase
MPVRAVKNKGKVLVAMSGGVDSSVTAQLLQNQGYEVAGVFLHFWQDDCDGAPRENRCCSLAAAADAQAVADKIGCHLYNFNFAAPFKTAVVDNFLSEYASGRTPNPCVRCNKQVKIGRLLKYAQGLGFDYVATGHYLKILRVGRECRLYRAKDLKKDQSYFLYTFTPEELKHLLFPLGVYTKPQVRQLAAKFGLKVAAKPDSQDICFINGDHNDFLKKYLKLQPGEIRRLDTNEKIGRHQGLPLYTIGQRRGLGGGGGPYYAAQFDYKNNILYVATDPQDPIFKVTELIAQEVNWLSGRSPRRALKCTAMLRYGATPVPCNVSRKNAHDYTVKFSRPERAIAAGQSVVFYDQERVLGGGIISML